MSSTHVLRTAGYYIGQVRDIGCRRWRTVTDEEPLPAPALRAVSSHIAPQVKRFRVLYMPSGDTGSYYEPSVWIEGKKP